MDTNELGKIAYQGAAKATGCDQPWSEANQEKWIGAGKAVLEASHTALAQLYLASMGMAESEPDMPSHSDVEAEFAGAMKDAHDRYSQPASGFLHSTNIDEEKRKFDDASAI